MNMTTETTALDDLVHQYVNAKAREDSAKKHRLLLEEEILALAPALEEGSKTIALDNGFKLTTTGKLSYKCDDVQGLLAACAQWPANLVPVKTVVALDDTGAKWLRKNEPEAWVTVANFVTVTPAKTAITVKV